MAKVEQSLFSTFVKGTGDIGRNAEGDLSLKQWEKFRDGYLAFVWAHWGELQKLPSVQILMQTIGKINPELCAVLKRVQQQTEAIISIQIDVPNLKHFPLPRIPAHRPETAEEALF